MTCFKEVYNLIEIKSISKSYSKNKVLDNINMSIYENTIISIVGKNGSGKSTLLSIMAGILKPDKGDVLYDQKSVFTKSTAKKVGFVAQDTNLFEEVSVSENIKFWAKASKIKAGDLKDNKFIKLLGVNEFRNKKVRELSGGMKKRVSICIALINDPKFIILDEPFSGLDLFYKQEIINCLKELKDMGKTVVFTSHNSDEIMRLSEFTYVINDGKIVFDEKTKNLLQYSEDANIALMQLITGEM